MGKEYMTTATGRHKIVPRTNIVRKNLFHPERTQAKRSQAKRDNVFLSPQQYDVDKIENNQKLRDEDIRTYLELYTRAQWTFRGVYEIATSIAKLPYRVTIPSASDLMRKETVPHRRLNRLLRNPNPLHTTYEFIVGTASFMLLAGNAYWFKERVGGPGSDTEIIGVHLVRPDRVTPKPRQDGRTSFVRRVNDKTQTWSDKDVVHFTLFNPLDFSMGMPHVQPGEDSAIIDLYLMTSDKKFWKNAINPRYVLEAKGDDMSDATFERLKYELNLFHQGAAEHHKVAILGNAELKELTNKHHVDANVLEHRHALRDEILGNLGVHHLVALNAHSNRSTLEMAYRLFWELTVLPLVSNIEGTVTKGVLWDMPLPSISEIPDLERIPPYRDIDSVDLDFEFDIRGEKALRESEVAQSLVDFRDIQTGVRTVNEVRYDRKLGPPLPGGDETSPMVQPFSRTRTDRNDLRTPQGEEALEERQNLETV